MGQIVSLRQGADWNENKIRVDSIDFKILQDKIEKMLQKADSRQDAKVIADKVFECLKGKVGTDFERNCKVFVSLENVGNLCVQSGIGAYNVAVFGDSFGYQAMVLEHYITTPEITGLLLSSLQHLLTSVPIHLIDELNEHAQRGLANAKDFVQRDSSGVNWNNATIDFNGILPLVIVSGTGKHKFTIADIQSSVETHNELRKGKQTINDNIIHKDLTKIDAIELAKLRVRFCGNEGTEKDHIKKQLEDQFIVLIDHYKQNQTEKYWKNVVIKIFNYDKVYIIKTGTGKKKTILVTCQSGKALVTIE